jgi:hypothetical protein
MGAQPTKEAPLSADRGTTTSSSSSANRGILIGSSSVLNNVLAQSTTSLCTNKGSRSPSLKGKFPVGSNIFTEHNGKSTGEKSTRGIHTSLRSID